ncbi:hypothetical protein LguiA_003399 [Lonicera macranthoides]
MKNMLFEIYLSRVVDILSAGIGQASQKDNIIPQLKTIKTEGVVRQNIRQNIAFFKNMRKSKLNTIKKNPTFLPSTSKLPSVREYEHHQPSLLDATNHHF